VNWTSFLDQVGEWLDSRDLLTPHRGWVVGVSGGPDSVVLLRALHAVSESRGLQWKLHVAHLHHGLRGAAADADAEFVAQLAAELGLPSHRGEADVRAQVAESGGTTEEVARQRRYEFLERVALTAGCDLVAVGHHADDNAETVLHRIVRGTGLRGLAGMSESRAIQPGSRVRLVRPLLHERREQIEQLCAELGYAYRLDATNGTTEFTRGRIRNTVLPFLREQLNPNVSEALLRLAEQAGWLGTYLEDAAVRTLDSLVVSEGNGHIGLSASRLMAKQRLVQAEVIRRTLAILIGGEQDLGFTHIDAVMKLAADGVSGKELHLPGSVVVRKVYDRLEFRPKGPSAETHEWASVFVACPGVTAIPALQAQLSVEERDVEAGVVAQLRQKPDPCEEWIDFECVQPPLIVRGRRDGDRFWPLGAPGTKSLGDFLGDEKVAPDTRDRVGVLCDQAGPIWVMPLRIDERVKLRDSTRRALRLRLTTPSGRTAI